MNPGTSEVLQLAVIVANNKLAVNGNKNDNM